MPRGDIPDELWSLIDRDHVLRSALDDIEGTIAFYQKLWAQALHACLADDSDRMDEILGPLNRDQLLLMVVMMVMQMAELTKGLQAKEQDQNQNHDEDHQQ
jgi:hypothetical protein